MIPEYIKSNLTFHCSEMMKEAVKGASFESIQLQRGVLDAKLTRVEFQKLCIDYGNYNLGLIAQGGMPKDRHTIGMILNCKSRSSYFKKNTVLGDIIYFPPGCELDVLLGSSPQWCTLSFENEYFEDARRDIIGLDCEFNDHHAAVIKRNSATAELLQTVITILFSSDSLLVGEEAQKARQGLCDDLLEICLRTVFQEKFTSVENSDCRKANLIKTAEAFINRQQFEPVQVNQLAKNLGVSVRTLEYAFKDIYDISPKKYLIAKKLNNVRQEIINHPKLSVTKHALNQGFWHMSQFALDYKRLFGELPSETKVKALSEQTHGNSYVLLDYARRIV